MKNGKLFVIIGGIIIAAALTFTVGIQSAQNRAIGLEESVYTAESDIKVQEKARVDKVYNLADCVKQYDRHESDTLNQLADKMSKGNQIEDVSTALAAVTYSYPELKSNENYKQLMQELTVIENQLSQYRENYNSNVKTYTLEVRTPGSVRTNDNVTTLKQYGTILISGGKIFANTPEKTISSG